MNCIYCEIELKPKGISHQIYCKKNPNRKIIDRSGDKNPMFGKSGSNQFVKAKNDGLLIEVSKETREKLSKSSKDRVYSEEHKKNLSETMKRVVRENPESYSASNVNGRSKKFLYDGVMMDSSWEFEFAKWCNDNELKWIKPTNGFEYEWNGSRIYYPDFYLTELDIYVEVKGYVRDRDLFKWRSVPNLIIVKSNDIKKIKNGTFKLEI